MKRENVRNGETGPQGRQAIVHQGPVYHSKELSVHFSYTEAKAV